ncbi:MAG: stage sporulation protein [Bacilli bacterium]|nr:stage sporulation protein [Bacilli bacterium]
MKGTAVTLDISKIRKFLQQVGVLSQTFAMLVTCTMLFFIILNLATYAHAKMNHSPTSSIRGLAASVSNSFFQDMIAFEIPHFTREAETSIFSQQNMVGFLFRIMTDINPLDPKTLLASEIPGLDNDNAVLLHKGKTTSLANTPEDYMPAKSTNTPKNSTSQTILITPAPAPAITSSPKPAAETTLAKPSTNGKKVVLIYHSHNRESWIPELGIKDPDKAYDDKTNITLVGKKLAKDLNDLGVGAVDYSPDYTSTEKGFKFIYSYKYSAKTVKEAFAANPDLQFEFDIHRDSQARAKTTTTINGKDYAQLLFIIGQKNPNWEVNEQFATQIHERMEAKMSGISRGIWGKSAHDGNAEYNQSLSPHSILIEVGGPYNTIEECNRTIDLLAGIIADLYWDAEKVNAPGTTVAKK